MTTLTDLGVTTAKLRAYGHDGKFEALTGEQLQGICCYLKTVLDKKEGKFKRWSKEVAKEMRGLGIQQHQRTGEPYTTYRKAKVVDNISVSLEDFNRVEDELQAEQLKVELLREEIEELKASPVTSLVDISEQEALEMMNKGKGVGAFKSITVDESSAIKPKRKRRSKEQIEADKAK